jgi:serine/threonine protein kinase/dipeptidyl aminopeptidase/acylaminoacyl peptidase
LLPAIVGLFPSKYLAVFMIGQVVSHYRILSELGAGGMGVVYLANDTVLKRRVAIKMLNARHLSRKNEPHLRLLREARAVSQINHPNIATVYDYGETSDGQPFIVMEYVDGEPLSKLIERKALTIKGTVEIIGAVTAALSEAHRRGIIHRDIKPSNIVLSHRDEVKVLDFGLAKQIENETLSPDGSTDLQSGFAAKTREGAVLGTPLYLSPEQATGAPIDERSDIFSLGSVLYECLTGRPPFYAQSSIEICARILRDDPPPPSQINPAVTAALDRITFKALAKDSNQRYQSAREFGQDLGFSDFKRTDEEYSPFAKSPTGETKNRVDTASADETDTKGQRHGSTAAESRPFSLFFDGLQNMWSGVGLFGRIIFLALVFLLTCALGYVGYRAVTKAPTKDITQSMRFQRLPISGNVKEAIISPDGKYVVAVIDEAGKQTIQLTELATSSNIRIAPLSEKGYRGLAFSPDNNYIYYLEEEIETATLYRVSKLGGNNRKLLENVNTAVTFSPDGSRISFVRYDMKERSTVLMTANEDGANDQRLATRKPPESYILDGVDGPAWSPSGDVIVCATIDMAPQPSQMYVEAISLKDGSRKRINKQGWYDIRKLSWLADGRGLIVAGANTLLDPTQLSLLSYPDGEVARITKDPNEYSTISSTSDSSLLLTVKTELLSTVWVMPSNSTDKATGLTTSQNKGVMGIAWLSENAFIHVAVGTDGLNIWSENTADGKSNQLTSLGGANYQPDISLDKHYIVFVSNRSGFFNIWRMNSDGTNQKQLTNGETDEDTPQITPDGKWVVYHRSRNEGHIWKVSIDGGEPLRLVSQDALYPAISPDGKMLACFIWDKNIDSKLWLGLFSLETGALLRKFALAPTVKLSSNRLRWSPDGQGLVLVNDVNGISNLWVQPLDGATPKPLTDFRDSQIFDFAWSPNGQQLACVRGTKPAHVVLIKGMNLN